MSSGSTYEISCFSISERNHKSNGITSSYIHLDCKLKHPEDFNGGNGCKGGKLNQSKLKKS